MIDPDDYRRAFRAIQGLLIVGRSMAYDGEPLERIAALLDGAEYLPGLVLEERERSLAFSEYLEGLCQKFPEAAWIWDEFQRNK